MKNTIDKLQHELKEKSREIEKFKLNEGRDQEDSGVILKRNLSDSPTHHHKGDLTVSSPQFSKTQTLREVKDEKDDLKTPNYNHKVSHMCVCTLHVIALYVCVHDYKIL